MGGLFAGNPLLDTAYIALVDGSSALRVAEPGEAVPSLREALRVLELYARAERYRTRGGTPEVLVDLARVRLAGTDTGSVRERTPRQPTGAERRRMKRLLAEAMELRERDPERAVQRLLHLQAEALATDPRLAAVLGEAVSAMQGGRDTSAPLARVRRLGEGPVSVSDSLGHWSGTW